MSARRKATSHASHSDGYARESESALLARRIEEICLDAVGSVSPAKVEGMAQQWLSKRNLIPTRPPAPFWSWRLSRSRAIWRCSRPRCWASRRSNALFASAAPTAWSARRSTRWPRQAFIYFSWKRAPRREHSSPRIWPMANACPCSTRTFPTAPATLVSQRGSRRCRTAVLSRSGP